MQRALVTPPRLLDDPQWERAVLGPYVDRARRRLFAQLEDGIARTDPRPAWLRAHRAVPFYQRRFREAALGRDDLRDLRARTAIPVTRRSDLSGGPAPFLAYPLAPCALDRGWLGRTSGSTGEPIMYLRDPRTHAGFWAFLDFALAYAGRAATSAPVMLLDALEHMPEYEARLPLFHDARFLKRTAGRAIVDAPQIVTGDPESLASLVHSGARPSLVLSSAFPLPATLRAEIAARTGAVVLEYYATQETSVIAIGCRDGHGYHPLTGACDIEVAAGEVCVTTLHNPSFPLIRYAPGDLATWRDGRCTCGFSGTLATLAGRTHVRFAAAQGDFAAALVGPLLARLPVLEHQLVQRAVDRYLLRYRGAPLADALVGPLRIRLAELARTSIVLELALVESIPRSSAKPQPFVIE